MKKVFIIIGLCVFLISCKKELADPGKTNSQALAGEWWVQLFYPNGSLAYSADYYGHLYTYNSAANNNEIWVDDADPNGSYLWDFKVKAQSDLNALTFSAKNAVSVVPGYNIKVNITDGKVLQNAGRSKSGNVTDSIYMKVEFSDDPGTIYSIRGHQRTGFLEDEH